MKDTWAVVAIGLNIRHPPQHVGVAQDGLPQREDYSWSSGTKILTFDRKPSSETTASGVLCSAPGVTLGFWELNGMEVVLLVGTSALATIILPEILGVFVT